MCSTRGNKVVNLLDYRARRVLSLIHKYGITPEECSQVVWYQDKSDIFVKVSKEADWLEVTQLLER